MPDISEWNIENIIKYNNIFNNCYSIMEKTNILKCRNKNSKIDLNLNLILIDYDKASNNK